MIGLLICPMPKLLNLALASDVEYISLSETPEHIRQVFSMDDNQSINNILPKARFANHVFGERVVMKILDLRQNKFFDKNERHELYLNTLDFGGDVIGIESASNYYFKKPISDLSFEESLTLAGLYKIFK